MRSPVPNPTAGRNSARRSARCRLDRLIVVTDEQSHDPVPQLKGYMINVASNQNGVGYGQWVHIDGWSDKVLDYIVKYEANALNEARDVFVGKQVHTRRPSMSLLKDALIHRQHVGSVLVRRLNVLRLQLGIVVKKVGMAHPGSQLPENVLDRQPRPLEDGLAQHDFLALLDIVLPANRHDVLPKPPMTL
jgi:hypothetical protein